MTHMMSHIIYDIKEKRLLGRPESQLLIEMISHPEQDDNNEEFNRKDLDGYIHGIIHNLKLWTIRQSRLKLLHLFNSNEAKSDMDIPVIKLDNNSGWFLLVAIYLGLLVSLDVPVQ